MNKHTKGEWYVNHHPFENQPEYVLAKVGDSGDDCRDIVGIAIVERSKNILEGWRSKEEAIANARLIAAAPEMIKALKAALYALEMNHSLVTNAKERMISIEGQSACLKAIAKAEGKTKNE